MFGYIKLDSKSTKLQKDVFKKNYCFLCKNIEKYYGQIPRFLLSFDVTFLTIFFSHQDYIAKIKSIKCFGTNKELREKLQDDFGKKCAALNLAMVAAKLQDNIHDDNSGLAKFVNFVLRNKYKKIQQDYKEMWDLLMNGYQTFFEYEKNNRPLEEIESMFAKLITDIAKECFGVEDEYKLNTLSYVAKWLYFIDACDDLDKDVKSNSFNSLKSYGSCANLFNNNYQFVKEHIEQEKNGLVPRKPNDLNEAVINRVVFFGLPESTYKVMAKKR